MYRNQPTIINTYRQNTRAQPAVSTQHNKTNTKIYLLHLYINTTISNRSSNMVILILFSHTTSPSSSSCTRLRCCCLREKMCTAHIPYKRTEVKLQSADESFVSYSWNMRFCSHCSNTKIRKNRPNHNNNKYNGV